ncbi:hypothetical protein I6N95_15940 [Vagococcus sp. BWB3-3]|uniref:Glycoside hydrolase family 38 N-terminal domain-containing protein n=1 Tax=Vagococcus allomyrinae TaxID=2794353 RepID=A0A940SVN6_9ENTE|nr:hypothetical protein [Vagococcus allomyrinae]
MKQLSKKWKIYLIHHSHTDIGYTDRQEKIERYHVDFIRQAIAIVDDIKAGKKEWDGFCWTCENYWQVENFYKHASPEERQTFEQYVEEGYLDVGLNYLNMTELVDKDILERMLARGKVFADGIKRPLTSAMTADINGFAWGYSQSLVDQGVKNLFSCLHAHHGMHPLFKKQRPFWWETPNGEQLLVWNSDHYHLGNEFYLAPNGQTSYQIKDEFVGDLTTDQLVVAEKRIFRYLANLEKEDYPYDFVPTMISGFISDNAAPNGEIIPLLRRWNQQFGQDVEIEMVGLNHFFEILRQQPQEIPVYSGDWPDWWADGVGSTPAATKIYRDAQRKYQLSLKLGSNGTGQPDQFQLAEDNLMMYAEHTWGYSSSVSEPWNTLVNDLDFRKAAYATNANRQISSHLDELLSELGEVSIRPNREKYFKVINPHDRPVKDHVKVLIEDWETIDNQRITGDLTDYFEVIDCRSGAILACQVEKTARAIEIAFVISLDAEESCKVQVVKKQYEPAIFRNEAYIGSDGVEDIATYPGKILTNSSYEIVNQFFQLTFDHQGIASIKNRQTQQELVRQDSQRPFIGIYEKTPITTDPCDERRRMGRNRKGRVVERQIAVLEEVQLINDGAVYTTIQLNYQLAGTQFYYLRLKVYKELPVITAVVRLQKQNEWAPENLYVSLPFSLGTGTTTFMEKTGTLFRPGIDQLPGTNTDFYLLQNGFCLTKEEEPSLVVALKDTPLVTVGELDHHLIELCSPATHQKNQQALYSWVMNNYWETNFKVDLSGFYEFEYNLALAPAEKTVAELAAFCQGINQGIMAIPI